MTSDLDDILRRSRETDLTVLLTAKEQAKQRALDDPTPSNLVAFEKATRMLDEATKNPAGRAQPPAGQSFATKAEVFRYLQENWKISQARFYEHCGDKHHPAILLPDPKSGHYLKETVDAYAEANLKFKTTGKRKDAEAEERLLKKLDSDQRLSDLRIEREAHKLAVEKGRYIPRADFEREMSARAVVLWNALTHAVEMSALPLVNLVAGDQSRLAEFIAALEDALKAPMHEFATLETFHVIFLADENPSREEEQ